MIHTLDTDRFCRMAHVWATPTLSFLQQANQRFGSLCPPCSHKRKRDLIGTRVQEEMPDLYCFLCCAMHPEICFSTLARHEPDNTLRVCLGHELTLQGCSHKAVSFQQVMLWAKYGAGGHEDNVMMAHRRNCNEYPCVLARCGDGRAKVSCHTDHQGKMKMTLDFATHVTFKLLPSGKLCPSSIRSELAAARNVPGVGSWEDSSSFSSHLSRIRNRLSSSFHSELAAARNAQGAGSWDDGSSLSSRFRSELAASLNVPNRGSWKDSSRFRSVDPMRIFDPNLCDCVEWLPSSHTGTLARWEHSPDPGRKEAAQGSDYTSTKGRCAYTRHGFDTTYDGITVKVDLMRCGLFEDRLVLKQSVECLLDPKFASGPGWDTLVRCLSYNVKDDDVAQGAVTCTWEGCALRKLADENTRAPGLYWRFGAKSTGAKEGPAIAKK